MAAIEQSRQLVFSKIDGTMTDVSEPIAVRVERISKFGTRKFKFVLFSLISRTSFCSICSHLDFTGHRIGGHTTEFVNKVLERVKQGVPDGGISEL